MKRLLWILIAVLASTTALVADEVPLFFSSYIQAPTQIRLGTDAYGTGYASGTVGGVCQTCFAFQVSTLEGNFQLTSSPIDSIYTSSQLNGFYPGGTISIVYGNTPFLSGYLLWAIGEGHEVTTINSIAGYNYTLSGAFIATTLNQDYWGTTDPASVGGLFSLENHYPHPPGMFEGSSALSVSPVPEPSTLIYGLFGTICISLIVLRRL